MQAQPPSSSGLKATTTPGHLQSTAIVGSALIGFLVMKTPEARSRLESLTEQARRLGELSASDIEVVSQLLATHTRLSAN